MPSITMCYCDHKYFVIGKFEIHNTNIICSPWDIIHGFLLNYVLFALYSLLMQTHMKPVKSMKAMQQIMLNATTIATMLQL